MVIAKLRSENNIEVPIKTIFEYPILKDFARHIEEQSLESLPPIIKAPRDNIPLSFSQQRLWFIEQLVDKGGLYHIPMTLRLKGELNTQALKKALDGIVQRHEILRTLILTQDGVASQVVLNEAGPLI